MKHKLGIVGGMGPSATALLYNRIIDHTVSSCDQDHIEMVILNDSLIPDRTKALLYNGKSPIERINNDINDLISLGCDYFIMPCNTAHAFKNEFNLQGKIKFINMIEETINYINETYPDKKVCVLCTNGTKDANVYKNDFVAIDYPKNQDKVMSVVTNTKAGLDVYFDIQEVIKEEENNFDIFLLACTELSLYKDQINTKKIVIDAMDILVKKAILACEKEYK